MSSWSNWFFRKLEIKYGTVPPSMSELKAAVKGISTDVSDFNSMQDPLSFLPSSFLKCLFAVSLLY